MILLGQDPGKNIYLSAPFGLESRWNEWKRGVHATRTVEKITRLAICFSKLTNVLLVLRW